MMTAITMTTSARLSIVVYELERKGSSLAIKLTVSIIFGRSSIEMDERGQQL